MIADWIGWLGNQPTARAIGRWTVGLAWLATAAAVFSGYIDLNRAMTNPEAHVVAPYATVHLRLGWALLIALTLLGIWRLRLNLGQLSAHGLYLGVAAGVMGATLFQGWFGGELVYTAGLNVVPARKSGVDSVTAQQNLESAYQWLTKIPGLQSSDQRPALPSSLPTTSIRDDQAKTPAPNTTSKEASKKIP